MLFRYVYWTLSGANRKKWGVDLFFFVHFFSHAPLSDSLCFVYGAVDAGPWCDEDLIYDTDYASSPEFCSSIVNIYSLA